MTVRELSKYTRINAVVSDFDGRKLCSSYSPQLNPRLSDREIIAIWPEFRVAEEKEWEVYAIICVAVEGSEEILESEKKRAETEIKATKVSAYFNHKCQKKWSWRQKIDWRGKNDPR